jgi:hypothetical protein
MAFGFGGPVSKVGRSVAGDADGVKTRHRWAERMGDRP